MTLLFIALSYLIGVSAGHLLWQMGFLTCDTPAWLWIAPLLALPPLLWWDRVRPPAGPSALRWPRSAGFEPPRPTLSALLLLAMVVSAAAGVLRYAGHPSSPCWQASDLAYYNAPAGTTDGVAVTLTGAVVGYPIVKDGQQRLQVEVDARLDQGRPIPLRGRMQISTRTLPRYHYGQRLQVSGILVEPPVFDRFDYRAYLARKGIHSLLQRPGIDLLSGEGGSPLMRLVYLLRARGEALLNRLLPEPYAALANGMLLGIESGIPDDLYEQFNRTGTSHVIVISGPTSP